MLECEQCKLAEDPVLRERTVQNIRDFVRNRGLLICLLARRMSPGGREELEGLER